MFFKNPRYISELTSTPHSMVHAHRLRQEAVECARNRLLYSLVNYYNIMNGSSMGSYIIIVICRTEHRTLHLFLNWLTKLD